MTAAPRFTVPRDDRRECALYRIYVLHPVTGKVVLGYIGETGRMPFTRFMEHLYDQPWGDTIVGHPHVDPKVFSGKPAVLAAEEAAVLTEKPLYNVEYQKGARHAIPQWTAREQRAERDRTRGVVTPDWAAKGQVPATPARRTSTRRSLSHKAKTRLTNAGIWLAAFTALWVAGASAASSLSAPWRTWPILSLAVCTLAPVLWRCKKRNRAAWTVVVAVAMAALWAVTA